MTLWLIRFILFTLPMYYPDVDNPRYFIKNKCWFLVAGWIGNKWKELHWSYEYVGSKSEWLKLLQKYKSEWIKRKQTD